MRPKTLNKRETANPSNRPKTSRIFARGGFMTPVVMLEMIPMTGINEWRLKALVTYGRNCPVVCCCMELMKKTRKILTISFTTGVSLQDIEDNQCFLGPYGRDSLDLCNTECLFLIRVEGRDAGSPISNRRRRLFPVGCSCL